MFKTFFKNENEKIDNTKFTTDEWVWVNGVKGTDCNMKGLENFQFEIGKAYIHNEEVELGENCFYFSKDIKDASTYCSVLERFFKVKGLVRKKDLDLYGSFDKDMYRRVKKLNAKEIVFIEEFSEEEYLGLAQIYYPIIETFEDIKVIREIGIDDFRRRRALEEFLEAGFTEVFSNILLDEFTSDSHFYLIPKLAKALTAENVSTDMKVYLIMKEIKGV